LTKSFLNFFQGENLTHLPRFLKFVYYITIVSAFCANMIVVSHTTALSVLGAGMALRGPDGSMMVATDEMYIERKHVFRIFGYGLACTVGSVLICVWLILQWEAALACMILTYMTCRTIWQNYERVHQKFYYDESQTVDFRDIMEGPAAIQAVPWKGVTAAFRGAKQAPRKSASVPLEVDDDSRSYDSRSYDRFDMEWQSNQNSDHKSDRVKRRTKTSPPNSNNQEHYIQTI
jgi:hypothetical protein